MTLVNITLNSSSSNEFEDIRLVDVVNHTELCIFNIIGMTQIYFNIDAYNWLDEMIAESKLEMRSDLDDLIDEVKIQLDKSKKILKKRYRFRLMFQSIKKVLKYISVFLLYPILYLITKSVIIYKKVFK